jgi:hypothetical protein
MGRIYSGLKVTLKYTLIILLVLVGLHGLANAQAKSRFCITVLDKVGATIPKAIIKFNPTKQSASKIKYKFTADSDGQIDVEVVDGIYDIEVKAETFHKVVLKRKQIPSDQRSCITIQLKTKIPPHQITL